MQDKKPKTRRGRPIIHGGYSIFTLAGQLPKNRRAIRAYVSEMRARFARDLGGEKNLTASQIVLVDRTATLLGACRCMEQWTEKTSIVMNNTLAPVLRENYLAYIGQIRLNIAALNLGVQVGVGPDKRVRFEFGKVQDQEDDKRRLIIEVVKTSPDPLNKELVFNMPRPGQEDGGRSEIGARKCLPEAVRGQGEAREGSDHQTADGKQNDCRASWSDIPKSGQGEVADQAQDRPGIEQGRPSASRIEELPFFDHIAKDGRAARNKVRQLQLEIENLGRRKRELLARKGKSDGIGDRRLIGEKKE